MSRLSQVEACLADFDARKRKMETELGAFEAARREAGAASVSPAERKAKRAEETFDRAMAAAGVGGGRPVDRAAAAAVAEVHALQREAAITKRLNGLRGAAPAAAPPTSRPRTRRPG